jgi:hypothetical protein
MVPGLPGRALGFAADMTITGFLTRTSKMIGNYILSAAPCQMRSGALLYPISTYCFGKQIIVVGGDNTASDD